MLMLDCVCNACRAAATKVALKNLARPPGGLNPQVEATTVPTGWKVGPDGSATCPLCLLGTERARPRVGFVMKHAGVEEALARAALNQCETNPDKAVAWLRSQGIAQG